MPGTRRTGEQWRALVADASRSGLTDNAYCEQHGVALSSFRRWQKIFREEGAGARSDPSQSVDPVTVKSHHAVSASAAAETKSIYRRKRTGANNPERPRAKLRSAKEPFTHEQCLSLARGWPLSGLTQSEYCERHGISVDDLRQWREVSAQERSGALPKALKPKREMRASSTGPGLATAGAEIESRRTHADPVQQPAVTVTTPVSASGNRGIDGPRQPADSVEQSPVPSTHSEHESAAAGIAATPEPADSVQQLWAAAERLSDDAGTGADGFGPERSSEDRAIEKPPTMRQSWSDRVVEWLGTPLKHSAGSGRQAIAVDTVRRWRETVTHRRGDARSQPADPDREHPKQSVRTGSVSGLAEGSPIYTRTRTITLDPAHLRDHRVVTGQTSSEAAEAYKILRTQVLQRLRANGWRTLGITATRQGHGKTLTALNLAISLAMEVNQTVLLVDLDLRHPALGRYLSKDNLYGISDYLIGRHDISEILINPGIERLVILPGNEYFINSSEQLSSPRMVQLVEELRSRYPDRIVLFDLPPLLLGDDVMAFAPNLDAIMLVLEEGKTTAEELRRAYELLDGQNIVGTVLNKSVYNIGAPGYGSYS